MKRYSNLPSFSSILYLLQTSLSFLPFSKVTSFVCHSPPPALFTLSFPLSLFLPFSTIFHITASSSLISSCSLLFNSISSSLHGYYFTLFLHTVFFYHLSLSSVPHCGAPTLCSFSYSFSTKRRYMLTPELSVRI